MQPLARTLAVVTKPNLRRGYDLVALPEGMQSVNFEKCYELTGTANILG